MRSHVRERSERTGESVVLCSSLSRLTWPVGSARAISVFFWSELAAGRRAWNTVCSAEWSSEGDPSRKQRGLFRGNIFYFFSCKVKALTDLHLR